MFEQGVLDLDINQQNETNEKALTEKKVDSTTIGYKNTVVNLISPEGEELGLCPHCQKNTMYDNKCSECGLGKGDEFCKKLEENQRSDLIDFGYLCENESLLMNEDSLIYNFFDKFKFYSLDIQNSSNKKFNLINVAVKDDNGLIYRIKLELSLKSNKCKILNITSNSKGENDQSTHLKKVLKSNLKLIINESYLHNGLDIIKPEYEKYQLSSIYDYTINGTGSSHSIYYLKYPGALKSGNGTIHLEIAKQVFTCNIDYKISRNRGDIESNTAYLKGCEISIKGQSTQKTEELIDSHVLNHLEDVVKGIINNGEYNPDIIDED